MPELEWLGKPTRRVELDHYYIDEETWEVFGNHVCYAIYTRGDYEVNFLTNHQPIPVSAEKSIELRKTVEERKKDSMISESAPYIPTT